MSAPFVFKKHYPVLDLLRAVAITLVLMRHFSDFFLRGSSGSVLGAFAWGWHGVDLFFALSGFLIGGQIIEECYNGRFSFKRFFVKRFWRIFPPYYAAIIVYVAFFSYKSGFFILENAEVLKDVLIHVLYLQDYMQTEKIMYSGVYWSLAVEEKFYLVLPLFLFFVTGWARAHTLKLLAAVSMLAVAVRFLLYDPTIHDIWSAFLVPFHMRFDNLLLGVVAAFLLIFFRERLYPWRYAIMAASAACLGATFLYGGLEVDYFNICWQFTLSSFGFAALVLCAVLIGPAVPFKGVFSLVAKISYSMYLYHLLALGILSAYLKGLLGSLGQGVASPLAVFSMYFGAVVLISSVAYLLVDRPSMKIRARILRD